MKKELIWLMIICFFIGSCISAIVFIPSFYERGLKASCSCKNNYNFSFVQEIEAFYEGQYNITGLGENRTY